jgi:hypothetical protein
MKGGYILLFKRKSKPLKIDTNSLNIYSKVFNSRKGMRSYFDHILYEDVKIDIRGNDISGFIDIFYKNIEVVKVCLDDFIFGGYTNILYQPCDEIVVEINKAIALCVNRANDYINKLQEEKIKSDDYANKVLGISR